jgi:predicted DNA-binding transcriptional regulator AlpA
VQSVEGLDVAAAVPAGSGCVMGLWRKRDVAEFLACSERTVERYAAQEGLPTMKPFGPRGPVRYDPAAVEAWWRARCAEQTTPIVVAVPEPVVWASLPEPEQGEVLAALARAVVDDGVSQAEARRRAERGEFGRAVRVPAYAVINAVKVERAKRDGSLDVGVRREAG